MCVRRFVAPLSARAGGPAADQKRRWTSIRGHDRPRNLGKAHRRLADDEHRRGKAAESACPRHHHYPGIVTVGTFKVYLARYPEPHWICAIHQIIAGAEKEDLDKAFFGNWGNEQFDSFVDFKEVGDIDQAVDLVLSTELRGWPRYEWLDPDLIAPKKSHREEFYQWLFGMAVGERMVRYGCDRYLNPLKKALRTIRAKVRKRRPIPVWLIPYQFGNRGQPGEYPNGYGRRRR